LVLVVLLLNSVEDPGLAEPPIDELPPNMLPDEPPPDEPIPMPDEPIPWAASFPWLPRRSRANVKTGTIRVHRMIRFLKG
jgi:hypothetical protein